MAKFTKIRSALYGTAKLLGDAEAILSLSPIKITKRVGRRITGKWTSKLLTSLFR